MLVRKHKVNERRACRLVGQHRSTNRYVPTPSDFEEKLVARMVELADEHPKWGYRMICGLLVAEGWGVDKKRIECLWRREGLQVPPMKAKNSDQRALGEDGNSIWKLPPEYRNHIWSYDFIKRRTSDGRSIRVLNVVDEFTRVGLGSFAARSIGAKSVQAHLAKLFARHGRPVLIRADNGREFIADTLLDWLGEQEVRGVFHRQGEPLAERLHRTLQRHHGTRAVRPRGLPLRPRGPARRRRMAGQVQHRPTPSKPRWPHPRGVRQDARGSELSVNGGGSQ